MMPQQFEVANDEVLYDLDYRGDLIRLLECIEPMQYVLDKLTRAIFLLGICNAPSKCC